MKIEKAIVLTLREFEKPVVTAYDLGLMIHRFYREKEYKGELLNQIKKPYAGSKIFWSLLKRLQNSGIIQDFPGNYDNLVYTISKISKDNIEDILCAVDPFCYISHLSAMEYHGLTDRIPTKVFISTPVSKRWNSLRDIKMKEDLRSDYELYKGNNMPSLTRFNIHKIERKEIVRHESSKIGTHRNVRGRIMRVSGIGRTFLDMLRKPDLCGGINHVLDVFVQCAEDYLDLIVNEIDKHGTQIDKVRAGYILEELVGTNHDFLESWVQFAQRGGSRKLDATQEYVPKFSEKWCLSLNVY